MAEVLSVEGVWKGFSRGGQWTRGAGGCLVRCRPGRDRGDRRRTPRGQDDAVEDRGGDGAPGSRGGVVGQPAGWPVLRDRSRARLLGHEIVWVRPRRAGAGARGLEVRRVAAGAAWARAQQAEQLAARALERVGARECIGRRWGDLSNWQRVLVGLARGFAGSPRVRDHRRSARRPRQPRHGGRRPICCARWWRSPSLAAGC